MAYATSLNLLLKDIADTAGDITVGSITQDSRDVVKGTLFVALKGTQQHGLAYADIAERQGAVAILWEADDQVSLPDVAIPLIEIKDLREHLGLIADRFYQSPAQSLKMIGITGTDGKTSISHFIAQALPDCAVIGTIGVGKLDELQKATHTTPDVITVHKTLSALKAHGVKTVAMEVSSHALDQGRIAHVAFDVVVLSNLSRDHLDYHGTVEAYADAKEKLFAWPNLTARVLNLDDVYGRKLAGKYPDHVLGYGIGDVMDYPPGSLVAASARFSSNGIQATIHYAGQQSQLNVSVLGRFNLSNLLAALGAMIGLGLSVDEAVTALNQVHIVEGRMEKVSGDDAQVLVVVDYAHTPNALQTVLQALREHVADQSQLICVFGCGGDRDAGKRPLMAQAAEQNADVIIVTDDNPRSENPQKIMQDIMAGFQDAEKVTVEHDRASAIHVALTQAQKGDVVLIAGKGHEQGQILATGVVPFSDKAEANKVLQELAA
jgi:UDP-N-acetylmuramoyl-L-alanyl-D-glutamate--2,6-diaminopimelate ligase